MVPDELRVAYAVGILCPVLFFGLFAAACCLRPTRSNGSAWLGSRRECGDAFTACCLVAFLCALTVGAVLFTISYEIDQYPNQTLNVQFCEAKFGGLFRASAACPGGVCPRGVYLPEWGSMVSAAFIVYCGMHMLYFWVHDAAMLRLIATMFCCNGVASFFYHMTNLRTWGETDGVRASVRAPSLAPAL